MLVKISDQLKSLRRKSKKSVAECAEKIGVSPSTYRDWEQGRSITGEPYLKIAQNFNVSLSELFGLIENDVAKELGQIQGELETLVLHIKNMRARL